MLTNIRGLVERLELSPGRGLYPLFEAISNAMDAIEDKHPRHALGSIVIRVASTHDLAHEGGDDTPIIDGFDVIDNGIGLDAEHLAAFSEAYTLSKAKIGGKGVGRFTFLKVFTSVSVQSVFEKDGQRFARDFQFSIDDEVKDAGNVTPSTAATGTTVSMRGMEDRFRAAWPHDPEILAERIIGQFLIRFAARSCPPMTLEFPGHQPVDLHKLFESSIVPHIDERTFEAGGQTFSLMAFRQKGGRARHDYHLCANGREVTSAKLKDILQELPDRFVDEQQTNFTLTVLVTGEYLDEHANQERTRISFQTDDEPDLDTSLISRRELNKSLADALRGLLQDDLRTTHDDKIAQIERFVETAPEYRVLTHPRYRTIIEQRVQAGLRDDQLDEALLHIRRDVEDGLRKEEKAVTALMETSTFESYQERMKQLMEDMNDVGKSKLADYIAHRRTILDLIQASLKRSHADAKYPFEKVLHKMIFPMGATSKDVFFDQQNLWMIDERLCFHTILTSDKKLNQVRGLEQTSGKEPDIFAFFYDTPIGVAELDNLPGGGIVIIEFKRPGRDDYDKDPGDQIIQRFWEIKNGNVKDIDSRLINPQGLRFMGYLIADLTPSLRRHVGPRYHQCADNEGYFLTLPDGNGYIEIMSYDKLVRDASRRNRVLFDKLGLHKS